LGGVDGWVPLQLTDHIFFDFCIGFHGNISWRAGLLRGR
jgi:hypothetical protein